jgi:hypothetical protein
MLPTHEGGDRRRFLKLLALVGMSAAVDVPRAVAQATRRAAPKPKPVTLPAKVDTSAAAAAKIVPSEDALALAQIVKRRYGKHLTDAQLAKVTEELENRIQAGRRLRDVKLANGEEPETIFRA